MALAYDGSDTLTAAEMRAQGRGRGGGGRRQLRRDFGKGDGNNVWQENRTRVAAQDDYQSRDTMCNEQFEEYYQQQGIVPDGEWDDFIASLKKQLPVTFRINGTGRFANEIRNRLTSDFFSHFDKGQLTVRRRALLCIRAAASEG